MKTVEIKEGVKIVTQDNPEHPYTKIYFPKEMTDREVRTELKRRSFPSETVYGAYVKIKRTPINTTIIIET